MTRPTALLTTLFFAACAPGQASIGDGDGIVDGNEGDTDTDSDADADADGDTDADTDSDTDTDTDADADLDGRYELEIELVGTAAQIGIEDACFGEGFIAVEADARTQVTGEFTCEFLGILGYLGPQTGSVIGSIEGDDQIAGMVTVDLLDDPLEDEFTATVQGDEMEGSFDGTLYFDYQGFELEIGYEAWFYGTR